MSSDIAYAVFCNDDGPHWWSWILHPEIRHCYVIIPTYGNWLALGKARDGVELKSVEDISDVVENDILIKSKIYRPKRGLFMLNTCVGHTKQVLGINKPFIWTPYQLYRYLERQNVGNF